MVASQDAHSACGIDHSAGDLQPDMTQPVTSPGITVRFESNAPYTTASASSQRPAMTKRKTSGAPIDIASYFAELNQAFNDEDRGRDEAEQHDLNSEPVPPMQQYTQAFLQAEKKVSNTVRRVSEYVKDEPEQDSKSLYMYEQLVAIEHPAYPAPVRVAISRNSGIGESTMTNATLGLPTLCPKSDADAGTLVSMEIVYAPADQPKKYAFHLDLSPLNDCIKIIKWTVMGYYNSCVDQGDDVAETQDADREGPALKVLRAVFQDKDEFADNEVAAEYLRTLDSADDPYALSQMLDWTFGIYKKLLAYISEGSLSASTAIELAEVAELFVLSAESPAIRLD